MAKSLHQCGQNWILGVQSNVSRKNKVRDEYITFKLILIFWRKKRTVRDNLWVILLKLPSTKPNAHHQIFKNILSEREKTSVNEVNYISKHHVE